MKAFRIYGWVQFYTHDQAEHLSLVVLGEDAEKELAKQQKRFAGTNNYGEPAYKTVLRIKEISVEMPD